MKKAAFLVLLQSTSFYFFVKEAHWGFLWWWGIFNLCVWGKENEVGTRKWWENYANAFHKHSFNNSYKHLSSFEYIHFAHAYISPVCVSVSCAAAVGSYSVSRCCVDSSGVTEVVAGGYERQVFTTSEENIKKKVANTEACQWETGDQSANNELPSSTVSLLFYGYRLISPLAPPWILVGGEQLYREGDGGGNQLKCASY